MDRQEILKVVMKHLCYNVDGLEGVEIDTSKSMMDYGASSLDIVEVVSSSMRALRIKVSTNELSRLKSIDELVDLFARVQQESSAQAPT